MIILLVDERPEEVTDFQRSIDGDNVEVVSSTFDEPAARTSPWPRWCSPRPNRWSKPANT
ncbi:MAG: hypothetical protein R3E96_00630 [Planctomycetota bacterium]